MKKILLLCLLSISFSQQIDYSKWSEAEKVLMYNSMKKTPVLASFLEVIPSVGYAYSGKWKRGLVIRFGIPVTCYSLWRIIDYQDINEGPERALVVLGASSVITFLYSIYDTNNQTSNYNKKLYKKIFGKELPKIGLNLYPLQDGAGISLTYSFN